MWIDETRQHDAERRNYTVIDPARALADHLTESIRRHADALMTPQEVNRLLDALKERSPELVDELVSGVVTSDQLRMVLRNLLREQVPIDDLQTILQTLADCIARTQDTKVLTEHVRNALARATCGTYADPNEEPDWVTVGLNE